MLTATLSVCILFLPSLSLWAWWDGRKPRRRKTDA
jgi:hypothetical protein